KTNLALGKYELTNILSGRRSSKVKYLNDTPVQNCSQANSIVGKSDSKLRVPVATTTLELRCAAT
ncbi:29519_t:CDS:1, partial [Gigaspora margarita]